MLSYNRRARYTAHVPSVTHTTAYDWEILRAGDGVARISAVLLASVKRRREDETKPKVDETVFLVFQVPGNKSRVTAKVYGHA